MKKLTLKIKNNPTYILKKNQSPSRYNILKEIDKLVNNDIAIIATTGKTGRELFTINDRKNFFYQVGSMGCASAIGLGIALNSKKKL